MNIAKYSAALAMLIMVTPLAHGLANMQADDTPQTEAVSDGRTLIDAFHDLCAAPFPDQTDFLNAMAMNSYGFTSQPIAKLPHRWISSGAKLVYADENMLQASGQPAPQCILDAVIPASDDHLALVKSIEAKLLIDEGKSQGRSGVNRTIWNYFDNAGNRLRVFFQTRPAKGNNLSMRLTLLRLSETANDDAELGAAKSPDVSSTYTISKPPTNEENEVSL